MATREEIELIRERIDMVEVLSRYIALKRSGRNFIGICPFHADKRPSLVVDPERKLFHCFGCGAGGDLFRFLMKIEHLDFGEAVERLAQEAGVELSQRAPSEWEGLRELNEQVADYFQKNLEAQTGAAARTYLEGRGIAQKAMKRFRLGYALPGWDNLLKEFGLRGKGVSLLVRLGLVVQGKSGYYDRFRDRVIFPLCDPQGRVSGFSGRIFRGEGKEDRPAKASRQDEPKYLNISNTPLFKKGEAVYGLHLARQGNPKELILVEGYTDVIALHQAGFTNAIATMGTALTDSQAHLLRRYVERVILAYDRDAAGQAATLRGMRSLSNTGLDVQIALLPPGEDPDSLIASKGRGALQRILDRTISFPQFYVGFLRDTYKGDIRAIINEAVSFMAQTIDAAAQFVIISELRKEFEIPEQEVEKQLISMRRRPRYRKQEVIDEDPTLGGRMRLHGDRFWGPEEHLLYFLLQGDLPLERAVRELKPENFPHYRPIIEAIFAQATQESSQGPGDSRLRTPRLPTLRLEQLLGSLEEADQRTVTELALSQVEFRDRERAIRDAIVAVQRPRLEREWVGLRERLSEAEGRGDRAEAQRLLMEQGRLRQELLRLKGKER